MILLSQNRGLRPYFLLLRLPYHSVRNGNTTFLQSLRQDSWFHRINGLQKSGYCFMVLSIHVIT